MIRQVTRVRLLLAKGVCINYTLYDIQNKIINNGALKPWACDDWLTLSTRAYHVGLTVMYAMYTLGEYISMSMKPFNVYKVKKYMISFEIFHHFIQGVCN